MSVELLKPNVIEILKLARESGVVEKLDPKKRIIFERYLGEDVTFYDLLSEAPGLRSPDGIRSRYRSAAQQVLDALSPLPKEMNPQDLLSPRDEVERRRNTKYRSRISQSKESNWRDNDYRKKAINSITGIKHKPVQPTQETINKRTASLSLRRLDLRTWRFATQNLVLGDIVQSGEMTHNEIQRLWKYFEDKNKKSRPSAKLMEKFSIAVAKTV